MPGSYARHLTTQHAQSDAHKLRPRERPITMRTVSQEHLGGVELGILQRFILALIIALSVPSFAAEANLTSPNPSEERSVQLSGVSLFYESFGPAEGETVLLISGTGMQLTAWPKELIDGLVQRGYRVVRFDNRDTGRSTTFEEEGWPDFEAVFAAMGAGLPLPLPYTIDDMVEDAVRTPRCPGDRESAHRRHVDGWNHRAAHGCRSPVPGTLAHLDRGGLRQSRDTRRGRSRGVSRDPSPLSRHHQGGVYRPPGDRRQSDRQPRSPSRRGHPPPVGRAQTSSVGFHREARLARAPRCWSPTSSTAPQSSMSIKAPTVILHGADDPLVPVESARDLAAKIPGADLRFVPGMGHDIPAGLVPTFVDAILAAASR